LSSSVSAASYSSSELLSSEYPPELLATLTPEEKALLVPLKQVNPLNPPLLISHDPSLLSSIATLRLTRLEEQQMLLQQQQQLQEEPQQDLQVTPLARTGSQMWAIDEDEEDKMLRLQPEDTDHPEEEVAEEDEEEDQSTEGSENSEDEKEDEDGELVSDDEVGFSDSSASAPLLPPSAVSSLSFPQASSVADPNLSLSIALSSRDAHATFFPAIFSAMKEKREQELLLEKQRKEQLLMLQGEQTASSQMPLERPSTAAQVVLRDPFPGIGGCLIV